MTERLQYLFIKMMAKHAPMKRSELTQRALPQLRIKMAELKNMLIVLEQDKMIERYQIEAAGKKSADYFALTIVGKIWLTKKNKEIKTGVKL